MASMFVIGIDFGNESSYIAVPRAGGIETISNDFSLRATPSCVAFSNRNRIIGVAAKNQLITNLRNTIFGFKRLLGKKWNDPSVDHELRYLPFQIIDRPNGIGIKVNYLDEDHVFSIQQITAMFFTKLKETAEAALKCEVNQCVISVPSFFDNTERQALLDAASIAGLKVLRIFNETTATALTYGIYKQDLPNLEENPRNVIFVDCGHTSLQVSACAFNKGKLKMLACAADPNLGGRDIDLILAEHISQDFVKRYDINPTKNLRAFVRLQGEVEKLKKQMSANSTKLPLNIECFMNDKDVHFEMKRSDMEALCAHLFDRVEQTLRKCLDESALRPEDIYAIEIVGGSTRVPAIKTLIEKVFGKAPSTTLNVDEAVARGCALQCAILCPGILVRDFSITDIQNYPIKMVWDPTAKDDGQMEVFPRNHPIPFTKMLTFYRREPFVLKAVYGHNDRPIGKFTVNDVKPNSEGQNQKVKLKAHINLNGVFSVVNASLSKKLETDSPEMEPMDVSPPPNDENEAQQQQSPAEAGATTPVSGENDSEGKGSEKKDRKKRSSTKTVDLPLQVELEGAYTPNELNNFVEYECKMVSSDRQERDRVDARNTLEEYVYELRGKLSSDDELASFIPEAERYKLCQQLDEIEAWLYEEGEDCQRHVYADKLKNLRETGEPIKKRKMEFESQPTLIEEFSSVLQLTQKAIEQYKAGDEKYSHLEQSEIGKVLESTEHAWKWVEETRSKLKVTSRYQNPPVSAEQIKTEKTNFEQTVYKILSKPKPQPPTPNPAPPQEPPKDDASKCASDANSEAATAASQLPNGDEKINA